MNIDVFAFFKLAFFGQQLFIGGSDQRIAALQNAQRADAVKRAHQRRKPVSALLHGLVDGSYHALVRSLQSQVEFLQLASRVPCKQSCMQPPEALLPVIGQSLHCLAQPPRRSALPAQQLRTPTSGVLFWQAPRDALQLWPPWLPRPVDGPPEPLASTLNTTGQRRPAGGGRHRSRARRWRPQIRNKIGDSEAG